MTENEALEKHKEDCRKCWDKACEHNIQCLQKKDIEVYERLMAFEAIGTVEELKTAMKYVSLAKKHGTVGKAIDACAEYESIGTIEEFKALKEKNEPKKQGNVNDKESHLILDNAGFLCCAVTGKAIRYPLISIRDLEYCPCCGQKLDWQ